MVAPHPTQGVSEFVGVLRQDGRRGLALRSAEAYAVERKGLDLDPRDLEIGILRGGELVGGEARQIGASLIQ